MQTPSGYAPDESKEVCPWSPASTSGRFFAKRPRLLSFQKAKPQRRNDTFAVPVHGTNVKRLVKAAGVHLIGFALIIARERFIRRWHATGSRKKLLRADWTTNFPN